MQRIYEQKRKSVYSIQTCCGFIWLDGQGQWIKPFEPFDVLCLQNFSSDQKFSAP